MTHQLNMFLLLFGALQGWLLSIWFLKNQNKKIANLYFALFLFVLGLQLTFKVITKVWLMENALIPYALSYKLPFLVGPLLFLYIKSRRDNVFTPVDLLHFVPFLFFSFVNILRVLGYYFPGDVHSYGQGAFQLFSLFTYAYLSYRLGNAQLRKFILLVAFCEAIIVATLAVMVVYYGRFPDVRLLFIVLTIFIYWISYQAISKPDLFLETARTEFIPATLKKISKYAHSSLSDDESSRIQQELYRLTQNEKVFCDSSLTIDILANRLNTNRHHLSQVLNEKLRKSYLDFILDYRLEQAKRLLKDARNLKFTIAALALDAGFSSVSNFNDQFKRRFGCTPSKFRDENISKMTA
jgi:AraC-like DNA-binding protein